jgi:acetyl-CoA hydrolase
MVPTALADHVEKNNLQGQLKYTLFVGASSGAETENRWARLNMIERRSPHQVGKEIAKGINNGQIKFFDKHLSMFPSDLVYVSMLRWMCCTAGSGVPAAESGKLGYDRR